MDQFKEMEDDWKETQDTRNILRYTKQREPKLIMQFPDKFAWFNLKNPTCDVDEAKAMGHCGNRAAGKSGETILSLRQLVHEVNGETHWYPVLTFILDEDGYLGRDEGQNNDKPVPRYHPYIIALLRSDIIKGIKGGGYMPSHNFHLSDLRS